MAPPPSKFNRSYDDKETPPSNNLWVGNLSSDTSDADLTELFAKFGPLEKVTTYSPRSFAFVYFKHVEDANAARDALQGTAFFGNPIKIEFARPARPCKQLWVGGISPIVSKEELEEEFLKFGNIQEFKFLKDGTIAVVEYSRLEDASQAMKNMNGKQIGGEQIQVDFLRSQPSRREQWPNSYDASVGTLGRGTGFSDNHSAYKRSHPQSSVGQNRDGPLSKILWVDYPPSVQMDEQMLHNAMILFGEIERIKSYPSRNYTFVEFRSVDEARRAKEGLQGRLFNDPRISIMFSSSELAPEKDYSGSYPGTKGPRQEMFFGDQIRPSQMDVLGPNHPMQPNNFVGHLQPTDVCGPRMPMRTFGANGYHETLLSGPEFTDFHSMQDSNAKNLDPNWRTLSSSPGIHTPPQGIRQPLSHASGSWDLYDANQFQLDSKRLRVDGSLSIDDAAFLSRKINDHGLGLEQSYGLGSITGGAASGAFVNVPARSCLSPVATKVTAGGFGRNHIDNECIWCGIIAKGGTPVCRARCVPVGKGIGRELPEVVNCSARTGLDMLAKHYTEAIGFDIVFFLPDSEDDFASYTEFLRYLGSKNRAGVAKFNDGTTLFLVPPSDFLSKVLKVVGPERLYGVVLKLPQQSVHSVDKQNIPPPHAEYSLISPKEEHVLPVDYNRFSHDDSKVQSKMHFPHASEPLLRQSNSVDYGSNNTVAISQAGVNLTPDLIATLASLIPVAQSAEGSQPTSGSSSLRPLLAEPHGQSIEQLGTQYNPQTQPPLAHHYVTMSDTPSHSAQMLLGNNQFQESSGSLQQQVMVSSRPLTNFSIAPQTANVAISPPLNQQYQFAAPPNTQKGYGVVQGTEASPLYADKVNLEHPNHVQQLQSVISGAGQGTSDGEVDKNKRYQSTLQFAANLLLQIQQQQQQTNLPAGQGTGNQQ